MMKIVQITEETVPVLADLFLEFWPDLDLTSEIKYCRKMLGNSEETAFLLQEVDSYHGFIHIKVRHDHVEGSDADSTAYLEGIYINPTLQKKGWGRKLLSTAEEWAKDKGFDQLASDVEIDNENSIDFHKHVGFQEVNRVVCFIKNF